MKILNILNILQVSLFYRKLPLYFENNHTYNHIHNTNLLLNCLSTNTIQYAINLTILIDFIKFDWKNNPKTMNYITKRSYEGRLTKPMSNNWKYKVTKSVKFKNTRSKGCQYQCFLYFKLKLSLFSKLKVDSCRIIIGGLKA